MNLVHCKLQEDFDDAAPEMCASCIVHNLDRRVAGGGDSSDYTNSEVDCYVPNQRGNHPNVAILLTTTADHWGAQDGTVDWGDMYAYSGDDGRAGCNGLKYSYLKVTDSIDMNWSIQDQADPPHVFNQAKNKAYWDWVYDGWDEQPSTCDYDQNCHGFAFGVGDWVLSATPLSFDMGDEEDSGDDVYCYVSSSCGTIACNSGHSHSVKTVCMSCAEGVKAITKAEEQFKESGTYVLNGTCLDPVTLTGGNDPRNGMTFGLLEEAP